MTDNNVEKEEKLVAESKSIIESELVDEMQAEISRFWETEMDRRGEFVTFEECANLWLEQHYAEWRANQMNLPAEGIKKRKYHRIDCDSPVKIGIIWSDNPSQAGFSEFVRMRDLSAGGLYIFSMHDIPHKSLLEVQLKVPDSNDEVKAMGVVVRKTPKEQGFGYGVSFSHIEENGAKMIKDFVARRIAASIKEGRPQQPPEA